MSSNETPSASKELKSYRNKELYIITRKMLYKKYNQGNFSFKNILTDYLIFNYKCRLTLLFKEFLLADNECEFLRRYYTREDIQNILGKILEIYCLYSKIYPNYIILKENKFLYKNIRKKQKMIDEKNKNEEIKNKNDDNGNDNVIYKGKITGEGEPDIRQTPLSVGYYHPGESRVMKVDIVWPDNVDHGEFEVDNGARIVDSNGTTIVREQTGKSHIEGETVFKWIFTAVIDLDPPHPQSGPDNPSDSVKTGETITFIAAVVMAVALTFMILFVVTKKKKEKEKTAKSAVSAENTETVVRSRIDDKPKNENDKE